MEGYKKQDDFEAQWASAFEGAEVEPSSHIWKNIVGALASQQVILYKRRVFFYQLLAAASLLLAFGLGVNYFFVGDTAQNALSQNDQATEVKSTDLFDENASSDERIAPDADQSMLAANDAVNANKSASAKNDSQSSERSSNVVQYGNEDGAAQDKGGSTELGGMVALIDEDEKEEEGKIHAIDERQEALVLVVIEDNPVQHQKNARNGTVSFIDFLESKFTTADSYVSAQALPEFFYKVPIYNYQEVTLDKETIKGSSSWAGLTMGSGSFNPNYGFSPAGEVFAANSRPLLEISLDSGVEPLEEEVENTTGVAFTVGIEVGKKIAPRWIIQTGLQYGVFTTSSSTNQIFSDGNSDRSVPVSFQNQVDLYSRNAIILQNEQVDLDNRFQMVAVPLRVGYIVLDKKFNVVINAGVSGDFYLGNSIGTGGNQNVDNFSFSPGENSPYRNFHLSALTGIQLGYHMGNNYYLSVEPNYRQAITEFTKESSLYSSNPSRVGIAFGFRYIFDGK